MFSVKYNAALLLSQYSTGLLIYVLLEAYHPTDTPGLINILFDLFRSPYCVV